MAPITIAYIHVRRSGQKIEVTGIATNKSKESQWYLFKDEDKLESKHRLVIDKWNALPKPPKEYRNFQISGDILDLYLNDEKTAFSFGGELLEIDEQNSIKQSGKFNLFLLIVFNKGLTNSIIFFEFRC